MKIFLDTANLDEIQQASDFGLLDGITTNPTLAAREGRPFRELILKACEIVKDGVVNAEVVSTDTDGMLREGRELARDRKSTRLNSSHTVISYAVFCLKKKKQ